MIAAVASASLLGVEGKPVTVEVHVSNGLPAFNVVGLPDTPCRESRDRVRSALLSSELPWPTRRITVNLAPGDVRKGGSGLDLAIAVGLLVAGEEIPAGLVEDLAFIGELGLDGSIRRVPGIVPLVECIDKPTVVVPRDGVEEATVVGRHVVRGASTLRELVESLRNSSWPEWHRQPRPAPTARITDLSEVRGQPMSRWALEVAAAGRHHLLFVGPPGSGKTMLAERLSSLLPPLTPAQALETTRVHSAAGLLPATSPLVTQPPFRAPHHGASPVSLIGGGAATLRPGEISLAHNGVLFLDELGEFPPGVLDALRQPLEQGTVTVCRARASMVLPARFLLVAAMNPCPCGEGNRPGRCRCSDVSRQRYVRRLSAPLLDRFDIRVNVDPPAPNQMLEGGAAESSDVVAERVLAARSKANERGVESNAQLSGAQLDEFAPLTPTARALLLRKLTDGTLSGRGLVRVRRIARTIADLDGGGDQIDELYVCAALDLRSEPSLMRSVA